MPTSQLTLTVQQAPHGLLTIVSSADGALTAAPQLNLTADAASSDVKPAHGI